MNVRDAARRIERLAKRYAREQVEGSQRGDWTPATVELALRAAFYEGADVVLQEVRGD